MKRILKALIVAICALTGCGMAAWGWTNPMTLPGLEDRSLGDPYIMKYRGYYYLYVSAGDEKIYCWKTRNLMDWEGPFVCCTDPVTAVAYAPEVIYWNGRFYMCTSPRGGGHYMLTSDSPTGPFVHRSENLGRDIDGSMFVDDDGKWYFYHANNSGIRGCDMPTHLSYGEDVDLHCWITRQWSEGPCVFKRNGLYYILYTGNHVWTPGYRIDYAISAAGPLSGFHAMADQNPILVDTETPSHNSLGHGTAFIGPDLDTYFFCYHNLQDNKRRRLLNFERIAWNGDKLIMTGPTYWEQDPPTVAVSDYFDRATPGDDWTFTSGGDWRIAGDESMEQNNPKGRQTAIFTPAAYEDYTAEFTVRTPKAGEGRAGILFSYLDANNFSEALIDSESNTLEVARWKEGKKVESRSIAMPEDFDPSCWHHLRVEKHGDTATVYMDGMRKCDQNISGKGSYVGYATEDGRGVFSYIAVSPYVGGSGSLAVSTPVPGLVPVTVATTMDGNVAFESFPMAVGNAKRAAVRAGNRLGYDLNARYDGHYNLGIRYSGGNACVRLLTDGEVVADSILLPPTEAESDVWIVNDVHLKRGKQNFTVEVIDGVLSMEEMIFRPAVFNPLPMSDDFESGMNTKWGYVEGDWKIENGRLESVGKYGKMLMGGFNDIHLSDYSAECDVIYEEGETNGGLLFRVTNASIGGADDNPVLGTDFLQGYILMAGNDSVTLGKFNFGWQPLVSVPMKVDLSQPHHLKAEVKGGDIRCYVDDMESPVIEYHDCDPFITGRAGLRAHNSRISFDNFRLTPLPRDKQTKK